MSDGHDASPPTQSVAEPVATPAAVALTAPAPAKHQSLAQQMQVFLTRTDIQQSRKTAFTYSRSLSF